MAAAVAEHRSGRLDDAERLYAAILVERPDHADALHYLGLIAFQRGDYERAVAGIGQAIRMRPDAAAYHVNLGNALKRAGRPDEALRSYDAALRLDPGMVPALFQRGVLLRTLGRTGAAVQSLREAVRRNRDWAEAWLELGQALYDDEAIDAAGDALRRALSLNPDLVPALIGLGAILLRFGDTAGAIQRFSHAERIDPRSQLACASRLFALGLVETAGERLLAAHRDWQRRFGDPIAPMPSVVKRRGDRLRVGYLSPDFRRHAMRFFVRPMFEHHDRRRVEVVAYATHRPGQSDEVTAALRARAQEWVDCHELSDAALARRIADDRIDVLVDLAGHTSGGRMQVLAARPAPAQCTMLGYMTTTGAECIDARVADPVAIPPSAERWFSERIVRLPTCQWCFSPDADPPPVAGAPIARDGCVTFGSFHNVAKMNAAVLGLWVRLLESLPGARLILVAWGEQARRWLRTPFEKAGMAHRVEIRDPVPHRGYLRLYDDIDISLDVFPYAGGTVSCESLWMGVPVLTLAFDAPAGRGGASILGAVGLPEWIAADPDDFLARAAWLSADRSRLVALRAGLRPKMSASPLMDGPTYARALEGILAEL